MSQADFEAFQKRDKKKKILLELTDRDTSFPAELAKLTGIPINEIDQLLSELVSEKLVEKIVGKYYKLTYDGYRLAKELSGRKAAW